MLKWGYFNYIIYMYDVGIRKKPGCVLIFDTSSPCQGEGIITHIRKNHHILHILV
jgi:hypothetical protein